MLKQESPTINCTQFLKFSLYSRGRSRCWLICFFSVSRASRMFTIHWTYTRSISDAPNAVGVPPMHRECSVYNVYFESAFALYLHISDNNFLCCTNKPPYHWQGTPPIWRVANGQKPSWSYSRTWGEWFRTKSRKMSEVIASWLTSLTNDPYLVQLTITVFSLAVSCAAVEMWQITVWGILIWYTLYAWLSALKFVAIGLRAPWALTKRVYYDRGYQICLKSNMYIYFHWTPDSRPTSFPQNDYRGSPSLLCG